MKKDDLEYIIFLYVSAILEMKTHGLVLQLPQSPQDEHSVPLCSAGELFHEETSLVNAWTMLILYSLSLSGCTLLL